MPKNIGQEEFIKRAKLVHGDNYDYSKTVYINQKTKVSITCPIHGDFLQYPQAHIKRGHGCPECGKVKQKEKSREYSKKRVKSRSDFILKARKIHGDKYDYSNVSEECPSYKKVKITCPTHGAFWQSVGNHLTGNGCSKCKYGTLTTPEFIAKADKIHNNIYDYSLVNYVNSTTPVNIICKEHGVFFQKPCHHLRGNGCPHCKKNKITSGSIKENQELFRKDKTLWFVTEAKKIHGDKYIYNKTTYIKSAQKTIITCPIHGEFLQTPNAHLTESGCEKCAKDRTSIVLRPTLEDFIKTAKQIHKDKYNYSLVEIPPRAECKVKIICPKHGIFQQKMYLHLRGYGCLSCGHFSKGEEKIESYLSKKGFNYKRQFYIKNEYVLCKNKRLFADFCINIGKNKVFIEYNGEQHYKPVKMWGGLDKFYDQQERDFAVRLYCQKHGIKLIVISYKDFNNIENILDLQLKDLT